MTTQQRWFLIVLFGFAGCGGGSGGGRGGCFNPCGSLCCGTTETCTNGSCVADSQCTKPCGNDCCMGEQQCMGGKCCVPCGGTCCAQGSVCLNGGCCANPCGATCCNAGALCVEDKAGNKGCATSCRTNAECPNTQSCCAWLENANTGACLDPTKVTNRCLCAAPSDCAGSPRGSACVPVTGGDLVFAKRYACAPNDGGAWHGCNGSVSCDNGYDCWVDANRNHICARSCASDAACGNPGIACCNTQATCNNAIFSCSGKGGCMTCP